MEAATGGETCCCDMTRVRKKMGLGLRVAAPRSKIDAPRGSAAATRVAAPDLNLELCYHITNGGGEEETELYACIEICPKGYIYKRRPQTLD